MASEPLFWVAAVACIAVLVVLMMGVLKFAKGGENNRIRSNNLMKLRLILQFVAVIAIMIFVYATRGGN